MADFETKVLEGFAKLYEEIAHLYGKVQSLETKTTGDSEVRSYYKKEDEVKLGDLPEFDGTLDPEVYLEWERKIERIFEHKGIDDYKCFTYAILKLSRLASLWYDNMQMRREREGKEKIKSWGLLKQKMKKRFVPRTYKQDLYHKYNTLQQHSMSVEDYIKEFERLSLACDCKDVEEQKISKFLVGLVPEICNKVELQPYFSFDEVCELAVKVERQIKTSKIKSFRPNYAHKTEIVKQVEKSEMMDKGKGVVETSKTEIHGRVPRTNRDEVKCFSCQGRGHYKSECPNRRVMTSMAYLALEEEDARYALMTKGKDVEQEGGLDEFENFDNQPLLEAAPDHETLVLRKVLHVQASPLEDSAQRENLFQTRCLVNGRSCSVIVDNGSCTNACSKKMVETLQLETREHTAPYKLNWLTNDGGVTVSKQALVSFEIGEFKDEAWCDVVPMDACALLLGRPWLFDRDVIYMGRKNVVSVLHEGRRIGLKPLPPKMVPKVIEVKKVISLTNHDEIDLNRKQRKEKKKEHLLQMTRKPPFDIGDYVFLSLSAQKFHNNNKGKDEPIEEGPFEIVHRENYDTFQVMLGKGVIASLAASDLVPCFDYGT